MMDARRPISTSQFRRAAGRFFRFGWCGAVGWLALLGGTGMTFSLAQETTIPPTPATRVAAEHLPNAIEVCSGLVSGGLPEGEAAFAELRDKGFRTVISVDGARPDVALAARYGLQYVHLPHGYDGIREDHAQALAKALKEFPGPIYLHCHHGKHRSPAAAVVAAIGAGRLPEKDARRILEFAGTSFAYRGLYQAVEAARPISAADLEALQVTFTSTATLPPMAEAMVEIEHVMDRIRKFRDHDWQPLPNHPDLTLPHEALLLREHYTELERLSDRKDYPDAFWKALSQSRMHVEQFERRLEQGVVETDSLAAALRQIEGDCQSCHRTYRDQPLSEKIRNAPQR